MTSHHEQSVVDGDSAEIAKRSYRAYVDKDRSAIERLIAEDFHFTSPLDNRIDRKTYFERCWPNSRWIDGFDFIAVVPSDDRVYVTYVGHSDRGRSFRPTLDATRLSLSTKLSYFAGLSSDLSLRVHGCRS
jgi:hypothetical protein